jgi:hypothetical protein
MKKLFLVVLLLSACTSIYADDAAPGPKVYKQNGINYVSGGIGEAGRKAMSAIAARYPIQLVFNLAGDPDVAGVKVTVTDLKGDKIVEAVAEGPLFYLNPIGGRYTFDVEYKGYKETKTKDAVGRRYLVLEFNIPEQKN